MVAALKRATDCCVSVFDNKIIGSKHGFHTSRLLRQFQRTLSPSKNAFSKTSGNIDCATLAVYEKGYSAQLRFLARCEMGQERRDESKDS